MSSVTLDKNIFNASLYKGVQSLWFQDHTPDKQDVDMSVVKRWFAGSPEERKQFDLQCRSSFAQALESIGPENFPNATAEPFLEEIRDVARRSPENDGAEAAWTALSFALLLDQIPRNIFRTNDGLVKVYTHYDKMAHSLVSTLLSPSSPIPRPDLHPQWKLSAAHRLWFYMPLMHSEDVESHKLFHEIMKEFQRDLDGVEGWEGSKMFLGQSDKNEKEHRELIDRFGRYPHRNRALGRVSTDEEKDFMKAGGATFGVTQDE
jgi:uncharacterized protein (DUF924 family)